MFFGQTTEKPNIQYNAQCLTKMIQIYKYI